MRLEAMLESVPNTRVIGNRDVEISHLVADSRQVKPGGLFFALRGQRSDGHLYLQQAIDGGAAALVVEKSAALPVMEKAIPIVKVEDSRMALGWFADRFYGHPSLQLCLIGVTGTNGKTTIAYLIKSILEAAGHRAGLLGTVAYEFGEERIHPTHTTPEAIQLQDLLARWVRKGGGYAVMEVSSHALALNRVEGCEFDLAVFTNLTQDHMDFHHTMDAYFESKKKLFSGLNQASRKSRSKRAVINRDDSWGCRLLESLSVPVWSYGMESEADFTPTDLCCSLEGSAFTANTPTGSMTVRSALVGRHNVYNILASIAVAVELEIPLDTIRHGIESLKGVPGRFERTDLGEGSSVIVDFAHTEAALDRVLRVVAEFTSGRVITVFGCGGDRDRGKRGPMGRVTAELSDLVLITSDNPRSEDPMHIIKAIEAGVEEGRTKKGRPVEVIILPDRREAIERGLSLVRPGDSLVIAGKGHEAYQLIGDRVIPFNDQEITMDWIQRRKPEGRIRGS